VGIIRTRLDVLLVDRGLAASREKAQALVLAGQVRVNGQLVSKAGTTFDPAAVIDVIGPEHPWVGRGGIKLAHALDAFTITVPGRDALDIGASTGGFTDVLLQRGAARVVALDVGRGQLDYRLRSDPRVTVMEGINARHLAPGDLPHAVSLVTIDVAFISLRHILPPLRLIADPGADVVALVKPQFEAGRAHVGKGGIVRDPAIHQQVLADVGEYADAASLDRIAMTPSPIQGAEGNVEFLLHLKVRGPMHP
jgi:23S rRNA (cytidine1920-2'-O)/16S rRNA (cytidine1409-2'-O)-methyltransferase